MHMGSHREVLLGFQYLYLFLKTVGPKTQKINVFQVLVTSGVDVRNQKRSSISALESGMTHGDVIIFEKNKIEEKPKKFTKFTGSKSIALVGKNFMEHVRSFIPNHQIKKHRQKSFQAEESNPTICWKISAMAQIGI